MTLPLRPPRQEHAAATSKALAATGRKPLAVGGSFIGSPLGTLRPYPNQDAATAMPGINPGRAGIRQPVQSGVERKDISRTRNDGEA